MRLGIIGSREFSDYDLLKKTLKQHWFCSQWGTWIKEVVSGGAKGADFLAARWAKENHIKLTEYIPDWEKYGKRAGPIRNEDIVKNSDAVLAFWDGKSKGTGNSLSIAKRLKKPTIIIYF